MARATRATTYLAAVLLAEIARRLALNALGVAGHGIRAISRELHVNRDTVRAIDRGEYEAQPQFDRCDGCGHSVMLPCRICEARAELAAA